MSSRRSPRVRIRGYWQPSVNGQWDLPSGGQQKCSLVANRTARWSPGVLPVGLVGQWRHPLAGGGLGEADAVAGGHDDVGVMQQPVDGGVGDVFLA